MALEDFERELAREQSEKLEKRRDRSRSRERHKHRHHHRHSERNHRSRDDDARDSRHRHKRRRYDDDDGERRSSRRERERANSPRSEGSDGERVPAKPATKPPPTKDMLENAPGEDIQPRKERDDWMQAPSKVGVDYVQHKKRDATPPTFLGSMEQDYKIKMHRNELNHHLQDVEKEVDNASTGGPSDLRMPVQHEVSYTFGDEGSTWRMTKLKNVFRQAKETGRNIEEIAIERFGDLRSFDDAREEEIELERRKAYGAEYVGKEKPSGELFQDRKLDRGIREDGNKDDDESEDEFEAAQAQGAKDKPPTTKTVPLDQTALNRLKAQLMRAQLQKSSDAARLEAEYNEALAAMANHKQADVLVLNTMENRMLAGGRKGEVNQIDNKRGRERGLVQENEDMSIEDMLRQEKRTRVQSGGSGRAFAESIAKDAKFDNNLDYMDENANKLAKSAQKSDVNLRNTAISDYQKMKRILDNCPLCHHEDTSTPPQAPLVSLATRTFLTLPTSPEITPYGLCASIVPIQHRLNLLECDDDEWEEIRNFMKSLARFYYSQKLHVIFYENAAHEGRKRHASLEAIPLPLKFSQTVPAFFKEAILSADEEWSQHRKIIDTQAKAENGLGKKAFRKSMVSELPYFHVWFTPDGGLGHVVEDTRRWPRGDLFAREIIGGILDRGPDVIKKQGRWRRGDPDMDERLKKFRNIWEKYDWTSVLMDAQ